MIGLGAVHSKQVCEMWCAWTHRCGVPGLIVWVQCIVNRCVRCGVPGLIVVVCLDSSLGAVHSKQVCEMWCAWTHRCGVPGLIVWVQYIVNRCVRCGVPGLIVAVACFLCTQEGHGMGSPPMLFLPVLVMV